VSQGRPERSARPLRVLAFSSIDLSLRAGHALHVQGVLGALAERGHEVELITPRPAGEVPTSRFRQRRVPLLRFRVLGPWSFELLGGWILLARALLWNPDLIWARQDLYTIAPGLVGRLLRTPFVVEVNGSIPDELELSGKRTARRIATVCERLSLAAASRVLVLSPELGARIERRLPSVSPRLRVLAIATHLPAEVDPRDVRAGHGIRETTFLVGFAGNLTPIQGLPFVFDAVAGLGPGRDVLLLIIGSGSEEAELRALAVPLGRRVRFLGAMERAGTDALLASCQALAASVRPDLRARITGGAVSSKLLTYLAADRPVLIPDLPDFVPLGASGAVTFYRAEDPPALRAVLESMEERWRAAGCPLADWPWDRPGPGRRFVQEGRTWAHRAARFEEIVAPLLAGGDAV
jgi:glycosyltransferase involved in cell wall biosynthesis